MSISETALKNHEELFPNQKSSLAVSDPELVEIFDNFALDEVLAYGNLDARTRLMVILSSMIACQALAEYRLMLGGALNVGVTPVEVKEIVYQAVPYVGMAKVFDFIHATNEILESRGVKLPLEGQAVTNPETRFEKGYAFQKSLIGAARIEQLYADAPANQLHIQKYLSDNCFGDWVIRKGVDIKTRELLTISMLMSLGGCEPQLKSHIQTNINVGNDKQSMLSVVTQLLPYIGYPRSLNALRCINEVLPE